MPIDLKNLIKRTLQDSIRKTNISASERRCEFADKNSLNVFFEYVGKGTLELEIIMIILCDEQYLEILIS